MGYGVRFAWFDVHIGSMNGGGEVSAETRGLSETGRMH